MKPFTLNKTILDSLGISYRADADNLILDCPVCGLENKGDGKLKIFPDGNFVCLRLVGNDQSDHKKNILKAFDLNEVASATSKPFMSETLFDGKLTLEIAPSGRDKQTVTARNCDSVLHLDRFNLNDATARAKFVKVLDRSENDSIICLKTLVNLADRYSRVASAIPETTESEPVVTSFAALPDGRIIEQVMTGFAVYDPVKQSTTIEKSIKDETGTLYVPDDSELFKQDIIKLAEMPAEYGGESDLDRAIESYLFKYIDLPDRERSICAKYARMTYLQERLLEVPYLRGIGESGNGKSRMCHTVGLACYRPLIAVNPSPASIFRIVDAYHPTLTIDEANFVQSEDTAELIRLLNSGYQRGNCVLRTEKGGDGGFTVKSYDVFGAKIIASLKTTDSQAFESRGIKILMQLTSRQDIRFRLSREMLSDARQIRNMLTLWRLRNFHRDIEADLEQAEYELKQAAVLPRYVQISTPLYAMLTDDSIKENFVAMLKDRNVSDSEIKQQTFDGRLLSVIHELLFEADDNGLPSGFREDENAAAPKDGEICELLLVSAITDKLNEGKSLKDQTTKDYVSKQISKLNLRTLKIRSRKSNFYDKKAVVFDRERFENLFQNFSLSVFDDFACPHLSAEVNANQINELNAASFLEASEHVSESWTHLNSNKINNLTTCGQVRTGETPESVENEFDGTFEQESEVTCPQIELPDYMQNCVALDTETEPFDLKLGITPNNAPVIGMSVCYDGQTADYVTDKNAWAFTLPEPEQTVIFHNAKFDLGVLERAGLETPKVWEDTFIAACLLDEAGEHGLKPLAKQLLGIPEPETFDEVNRWRLLDPERFENYAKNDARYTFQLWQQFKPQLDAQGLNELYALEKQLVPVVRQMENVGMKLDIAELTELDRFIKSESERLTQSVYEHAGTEFDLHSPNKTAAILYDKLGLTCPKETSKGARSLDAESLKELEGSHPVINVLLELRQLDKLASTFTKQLLKMRDGDRIKAEFKQLGAISGRFTCSKPNLQQVPNRSELGKRLRSCFIADTGKKLVVADWSQMELRVLAHFSQDAELLKAYLSNADLHELTAQKMFKTVDVSKEQRTIAKMINFGIAYGITPIGLYRRLVTQNVAVTETDCETFIETYFSTYKGVATFLKQVETTVKKRGYVRSILGRRRRVWGADKRQVRQAQNFVIQATAADLAKIALLKLSRRLPDGAQIISMIHDEFVIECAADIAESVRQLTIEIMSETPKDFTVKMEVEAKIVTRWSDAK